MTPPPIIVRWKVAGEGGLCPHCEQIVDVEISEFGATRQRCPACNVVLPPSTPPEGLAAPARARSRRTRGVRNDRPRPRRPCPRGSRCRGDGFYEPLRGRPSPYGCLPCRVARERAA